MIKHFVEDLPANNYNQQLEDLSKVFEAAADEVVSIKIRPIRVNLNKYENAYASSWDYRDFREHIEENKADFRKVETDYSSALIETKTGEKILYVEHETGPELVFEAIKLTAEFANAIIALVLFIIERSKKNDNKHHKKEQGKNRIQAISIEKRKKGKKVKIIKIIQLEDVDKLETKKEVKMLLKRLK